ncbi:hypothetical protein NE857_32135 [Nocardiopsis exhalans]|uniref:2TM domain-containing protein n=1 Tax=Nocardiopsis exhalans TaxID=163604 RepID=A0ABY5D9K2_9ACTN|nr:hypothetical protein [Nocardiopsis exhalans]USY19827.1 hypothetical protein NE857_32135 [Nocardiopsis exhalans]
MYAKKILLAHNVAVVAALIVILVGSLTTGIIWWLWAIWGGLAVGVATVHILARRADLM